MKKSQDSADSTQQHSEQGSDLFLSSSLNDHTGSYATVLTEEGGGIATVMRRAEDGPDADTLTGRITAAAREAEEGVTMEAELPRLIDTISTFNLAFFAATEATAAP
ncbi:hypothetical protein BDDG_12461 [Blastomyces dermatitidis ATCC 18188]|uniref:Uncharacterized protein n=1 Tax=Ajellomyces dermatitidis (strain ATCC 18188 / CBS 674.68) TaxID=653446 RepID=A0A0J9ERZ6_AJEDA|nr:hypothetical protein BDDG_12461 [Blastomyces dermatitidis ATCC 18188]